MHFSSTYFFKRFNEKKNHITVAAVDILEISIDLNTSDSKLKEQKSPKLFLTVPNYNFSKKYSRNLQKPKSTCSKKSLQPCWLGHRTYFPGNF
jgi:hypothetical protein